MPRKNREWYEGACYHVMARGNRKTALFQAEDDFRIFLNLIKNVKEKHPFLLHAFCLMTNHFHLELTTLSDPIWVIMKPIMQNYAIWFNNRYDFEGHVFDSRYTSCLIKDDVYFLEVSRYIHLNPVKAAIVKTPIDYAYSSYKYYAFTEPKTGIKFLDTEQVLNLVPGQSREQYRIFVEEQISHSDNETLIQRDIKEDDMWLS